VISLPIPGRTRYAAPMRKGISLARNGSLTERWRASMLTFLYMELDTATIFAGLARNVERQRDSQSCVAHARKAYDTVLRFAGRIPLQQAERTRVNQSLEDVRSQLRDLGEIVAAETVEADDDSCGDAELRSSVRRFLLWCAVLHGETRRMLLQNRALMGVNGKRAAPAMKAFSSEDPRG